MLSRGRKDVERLQVEVVEVRLPLALLLLPRRRRRRHRLGGGLLAAAVVEADLALPWACCVEVVPLLPMPMLLLLLLLLQQRRIQPHLLRQ